MGQIADDIIQGRCCSLCNIYFVEEHFYPVVCEDCWADLTNAEKQGYEKAIYEEE
ncbi:MAG: hypothetical protein LBJ63_00075 [Prevotellaceae bacterium]|jgi:hypothetical protein|nr:hypothetical protein [Prevotellaceae bacterium]